MLQTLRRSPSSLPGKAVGRHGSRQDTRALREMGVDRGGGATALGDGPDDQALSPHRVAAGKDGRRAFQRATLAVDSEWRVGALEGPAPVFACGDAPLAVDRKRGARRDERFTGETELIEFGTDEAGRDQNEIGGHDNGVIARVIANDDSFDLIDTVELERLGRKASLPAFVVRRRRLEDPRHGGPGLIVGPVIRWTHKNLDLDDGPGALSVHGAQTVGARVTSAEDDDVLVFGVDD